MDGFNHFVTSLFSSSKKMAGMVIILLIAVAVPVTLGLLKQNQDIRQEAATNLTCTLLPLEKLSNTSFKATVEFNGSGAQNYSTFDWKLHYSDGTEIPNKRVWTAKPNDPPATHNFQNLESGKSYALVVQFTKANGGDPFPCGTQHITLSSNNDQNQNNNNNSGTVPTINPSNAPFVQNFEVRPSEVKENTKTEILIPLPSGRAVTEYAIYIHGTNQPKPLQASQNNYNPDNVGADTFYRLNTPGSSTARFSAPAKAGTYYIAVNAVTGAYICSWDGKIYYRNPNTGQVEATGQTCQNSLKTLKVTSSTSGGVGGQASCTLDVSSAVPNIIRASVSATNFSSEYNRIRWRIYNSGGSLVKDEHTTADPNFTTPMSQQFPNIEAGRYDVIAEYYSTQSLPAILCGNKSVTVSDPVDPGTNNPGTNDPGTSNPGTNNPGGWDPGSGFPGGNPGGIGGGPISSLFSIKGTVFVDANKNKRMDSGEKGFEGATVKAYGTQVNTDSSGKYSIPVSGLTMSTLELTVPPCYTATTDTSIRVSPLSFGDINFGIMPSTGAGCGTTPTVTPTVTTTPVPACGATCASSAACAGAANGCSTCVTGSNGQKTCQASTNTNQINLAVSVEMPGIGTRTGDNRNPARTTRTGKVEVYNTQNEKVKEGDINFTFTLASQSAVYNGTVEMTNMAEGTYYVKVRFDNTVFEQLPGVYNLKKGNNTLPTIALAPGDLNQDNNLDMQDYSVFVSCYGDKNCGDNTKKLADFNDDGKVDGVDYNILIRSFAIRSGD